MFNKLNMIGNFKVTFFKLYYLLELFSLTRKHAPVQKVTLVDFTSFAPLQEFRHQRQAGLTWQQQSERPCLRLPAHGIHTHTQAAS